MKKILSIILCLVPVVSFATSMCVEDDTVAVVLDPSQNGTTSVYTPIGGSDASAGTWNVTFTWGRIYGVSTCVSANYGDVVTEIIDNGDVVGGGEKNGGTCYCRMTHPAVSAWMLKYTSTNTDANINACVSGTNSNCSTACVSYHGGLHTLKTGYALRQKIFGSITE